MRPMDMRAAVRQHWPEYLMEAAGLGLFMVSASVFAILLFHPRSPAPSILGDVLARRALMGLAMALTAIALIYSPWGRQSGAHFNPAVTLTFLWLGKVGAWDALFYVAAQFVGGVSGMLLVAAVAGPLVGDPAVNYVVTVPGSSGVAVAFAAEVGIAFGMMTMVLAVSNSPRWARFTGLFAGVLVAAYITLEAPLSGMSLNPARTFASAVPAAVWQAFWIYLTAPVTGMLLAAALRVHWARRPVLCAKLQHEHARRCIFRCGYILGGGLRPPISIIEGLGSAGGPPHLALQSLVARSKLAPRCLPPGLDGAGEAGTRTRVTPDRFQQQEN